jgi:spore coat protein A
MIQPPFVDPLPIPPRRVIAEPIRFNVRLQAAMHEFHSGLPPSRVWTYDGHLPGPTIEVPRGVPVEVLWDHRLEGTLPVTVVRAPSFEVEGGARAVRCGSQWRRPRR